MGQEESHIDSSQVTGFNPDPEATKRRKAIDEKRKAFNEAKAQEEDAFFGRVDVKDHIRPIFEETKRSDKENIEEEVEGAIDLTKLLNELGIKGKEEDSDDKNLMDFPDDNENDTDEEESDEDEDRGLFHHELKEDDKPEISIYSTEAHPIAIKGDLSVGETLRYKDLSNWREQYPVFKVEWFLGAEIGTQITFKTVAEVEGSHFVLPPESVGRYVQVITTRRVENQIRGTYGEEVEGGVYDPHVHKAAHIETGTERTYTDVSSSAISGPVFIPDNWSYAIMTALKEGEFKCAVKLRDELIGNEESGNDFIKGKVLKKIAATLTVTFTSVEFHYEIPEDVSHKSGSSSLFSLEWLTKLIGYNKTMLRGNNDGSGGSDINLPTGHVTAQLKMKSIVFRPSTSKRTIILATKPRKKGYSHVAVLQDLIRFDIDPAIGRDVALYILLAFQAAVKFKQNDIELWKKAYVNGEVDKGKDLVQQYLEVITTSVQEDAPAYEEMPLTPWDY